MSQSARKSAAGGGFDAIDRQILDLLQDRDIPLAALAEAVGLSQTPCWRRVRKLEEAGVIRGRVTLVDPRQAGARMVMFIGVSALRHEARWLEDFRALVDGIPEVVEAYRMTGSTDYVLKLLVPDIETYARIYQHMVERLEFSQINASIAIEELKYTTAVPTAYL